MPASIDDSGVIHQKGPLPPAVFPKRVPFSADTMAPPPYYLPQLTTTAAPNMYSGTQPHTAVSSAYPTCSSSATSSSLLHSDSVYNTPKTNYSTSQMYTSPDLCSQYKTNSLPQTTQSDHKYPAINNVNFYPLPNPKDGVHSKASRSPKPKTENKFSGVMCQVCGEAASGNFFGATVCLPCKTFFIRCTMEDVRTFRCRRHGDCEIGGPNRSRCKHCRYMKCILVGMVRKERPERVEVSEGQQLCTVCKDVANGIHFGVISCEGCKKFFRRGLQESDSYVCKYSRMCPINPKTRNDCRYCRFKACLSAGMSRDAIKMGRPRKNVHDGTSPDYPTVNLIHGMDTFPGYSDLQTQIMMRNASFKGTPTSAELMSRHPHRAHPYIQRDNHDVFPSYNVSTCVPENRVMSQQYVSNPAYRGMTTQRIPTPGSLSSSRSESSYESGNDESDIDTPLDCSIKREPPSPINSWPSTPVKSEPPSPPPTETQQPPSPEDGTRQSQPKQEIYLKYVFDEGYWLEPPALRCEDTSVQEPERDLISSVTSSYVEFVKTLGEWKDTSNCMDTPSDIEKTMQAEIVHQLSTVIKFVQNIPGFKDCLPEDKYIVFRLGAIQLCCLISAINFYQQSTHNFSSSFYNKALPESHPLYEFRVKLLEQARHLHSMKLDPVETAMLSAVIMIATDWPCLQCPRTLGRIRARLLKAFKSYTNSKYGVTSKRVEELFTLVPSLRELGMFHYRITFVM